MTDHYNIDNLLPSPPDSRDKIANLPNLPELPDSVDLKPYVYEVENQGRISSCTANAGCSALELLYKLHNTPVDLSRLYLYYYTRLLGNLKGDVGSYPRDIGKALYKYGVCYEENWQYSIDLLDKEPTDVVQQEAAKFKILSYERLEGDLVTQIKNAVAQQIPVLINIATNNEFKSLKGEWKSHQWDNSVISGWHEILVIGYDDKSQRFLCENSWGSTWGDGGFFGLPYSHVLSSSFGEAWVLHPNYNVEISKQPTSFLKIIKENFISIIGIGLTAATIISAARFL